MLYQYNQRTQFEEMTSNLIHIGRAAKLRLALFGLMAISLTCLFQIGGPGSRRQLVATVQVRSVAPATAPSYSTKQKAVLKPKKDPYEWRKLDPQLLEAEVDSVAGFMYSDKYLMKKYKIPFTDISLEATISYAYTKIFLKRDFEHWGCFMRLKMPEGYENTKGYFMDKGHVVVLFDLRAVGVRAKPCYTDPSLIVDKSVQDKLSELVYLKCNEPKTLRQACEHRQHRKWQPNVYKAYRNPDDEESKVFLCQNLIEDVYQLLGVRDYNDNPVHTPEQVQSFLTGLVYMKMRPMITSRR